MSAVRLSLLAMIFFASTFSFDGRAQPIAPAAPVPRSAAVAPALGDYVILGWNDLGMHCMNQDYSKLVVLPPFNNLWAQVIKRGATPTLVTSGVTIAYRFPDNTTSANKVNFWTYAQSLFGLAKPLTPDIGLTGNGLAGQLTWNGSAFEATGVPLTPYDDAAPNVLQPYQLAVLRLTDATTKDFLDQTTIVAPVSVELHCDKCHHEDGMSTEDSILAEHEAPTGKRPVLCAGCHASNALGTAGKPGLPSLSQAVHGHHAEEAHGISCYDCHPGQQTQCLRDVMFQKGKWCTDCHGSLAQVASSIRAGRRPWFDEPRCETCHAGHAENPGKLYRNSTGHGGMYCTACHNSPHAILPTVQTRDSLQVLRVQGQATYLKDCRVCHVSRPMGEGPHGVIPSWMISAYLAQTVTLTPDQQTRADTNHDGVVNVADAIDQVNRGL